MNHLEKLNDTLNTSYLSSNHRVIFYLQNSTTNSFNILSKDSSNDLYNIKQIPSYNRTNSLSEDDLLSRSDFSSTSSLSDQITSSNTSLSEELDFDFGFDRTSDDDDDEEETQEISDKNNGTLNLFGKSKLKAYIDELEKVHDQSLKQSILHDSTYTLHSEDLVTPYTTDNEEIEDGIGIRSKSLNLARSKAKSIVLNKQQKKVVRFADKLGLDLETIRYMTPPDHSTNSFMSEFTQLHSIKNQNNSIRSPFSLSSTHLNQYNLISKNFTSPTNIFPLIYEKQVILECLYTKDSIAYGTIRVHNLNYNKNVFVRLTYNEWKTFNNIQAYYLTSYSNNNTDVFIFEINLAKFNNNDDKTKLKRILFAICLQTMGKEFWDNNQQSNYVLDVILKDDRYITK
ncbi:unnamed protein product [Rotaria sordida]|uniref:CBM21 domain-containing protein n=2 Tax=Rotaria sordida TaxID=392033 RepID=A0A815U8B7_9BILA|nr:unnamed protein product [Rotaria sordida]CAF1517312.1 unnamed protein product [Rotaria sordida]